MSPGCRRPAWVGLVCSGTCCTGGGGRGVEAGVLRSLAGGNAAGGLPARSTPGAGGGGRGARGAWRQRRNGRSPGACGLRRPRRASWLAGKKRGGEASKRTCFGGGGAMGCQMWGADNLTRTQALHMVRVYVNFYHTTWARRF